MLKFAIIGYGRMGKEIEKAARAKGHDIFLTIDNEQDWKNNARKMSNADLAFEFTEPGTATRNIKRCIDAGIPVVTGTTGWEDNLGDVTAYCRKHNGTVFYASNFSPGMNIFFKINRILAENMGQFPDYSIFLKETHHAQKLDKPSGTAIKLANAIVEKHQGKSSWTNTPAKNAQTLEIISVRKENVPGIHSVTYESGEDRIEIQHTAKNREGFAKGALMAAEWVHGRKGMFTMEDMLNL